MSDKNTVGFRNYEHFREVFKKLDTFNKGTIDFVSYLYQTYLNLRDNSLIIVDGPSRQFTLTNPPSIEKNFS